MNRLDLVDDKTFQGNLGGLRLENTTEHTHHAPPGDPNPDKTSLESKFDTLAVDSPTNDNSCPPSATLDELCEACQKIDFDALTEGGHFGSPLNESAPLWSLEPQLYRVLEASARSCRLCRFLTEFFKELLDPMLKDNLDPEMVSLSNNENEYFSTWLWDFSNLAMNLGGYLRPFFNLHIQYQNPSTNNGIWDRIKFCRRPGSDRPPLGFRVPTLRAPFDLIQSWLDFCQLHHGPDCFEGLAFTIQSLKVIDCEPATRRVVAFSPELGKYAALSYVWGATSHNVDTPPLLVPGGLPSVLPKTIEDAITVTLNLSF